MTARSFPLPYEFSGVSFGDTLPMLEPIPLYSRLTTRLLWLQAYLVQHFYERRGSRVYSLLSGSMQGGDGDQCVSSVIVKQGGNI
jgi:hypothetical protein